MSRTLPTRFLVVWSGQLLSSLGTGMTAFALGVHVFTETQSATGFALVILSLFLPSILLRPLGGVLADVMDRRSLIVFGDIGSAAAVLFILLNLQRGTWSLSMIYIGVAVSSAFTALQNPAYKASVTDLVPKEQFSRAGGLVQLAASVQHLIAPLAAGLVLGAFGVEAVLFVDIATFVAAVAAVLSIQGDVRPKRSVRPTRLFSELKHGTKALFGHREVLDTVTVVAVVTFFVGLLQTLFAPMMLTLTSSRTLGLAQSISASGMVISSLLIGVIGFSRLTRKSMIPISLAAAGLFLALMGVSTNVLWITASFFLFFFCLPLINTSAELQIRSGIPNELQGRAWGIIGLISQTGYVVAYLSGGVLADKVFGPLLLSGGTLAPSAGRLIGVGPGRGIALMLCLAGFGLTLTAALKVLSDRKGAYQL